MNYCQRGVIMDLGMAFISISAFLMGFVVMWIGFFFISRELQFTAAEFGGFITSFFGGAVIAVYTTMLNPATQILFWWYPIGLAVGLLVYHLAPASAKKLNYFGH